MEQRLVQDIRDRCKQVGRYCERDTGTQRKKRRS